MKPRQARLHRKTRETNIRLSLRLDGRGTSSIRTGVPFFDHMLTLFAKHAVVDLTLRCDGDLDVDAHHTVEDCGIASGTGLPPGAWATSAASAATAAGLIRATRSPARPTCRWTSAWPAA